MAYLKLSSSLIIEFVLKNWIETVLSACSGQLSNQSSVQQFTSDGKFRHLTLSWSPTGDMHRIMWQFSLSSLMKVKYMSSWLYGMPCSFMNFANEAAILSKSSFSYRSAISPVLRTQLMSSRNCSWIIWVSANRNTFGFLSQPEARSVFLISSRKLSGL